MITRVSIRSDKILASGSAQEQAELMRQAISEISVYGDLAVLYVLAIPETWALQPYIEGFEVVGGRINFSFDNVRRTR